MSNTTTPPPEGSENSRSSLTYYEKNQAFNPLVSFLHSFRYKHLLNLFARLQSGNCLRVVDIGCAHAKVFQLLNSKFKISYVGVELDKNFA
jgi:hypothetical protein